METKDFNIINESGQGFDLITPDIDTEYNITISEAPQIEKEYIDVEFDFFCKIKKLRKQNMTLKLFYNDRELLYQIENGEKSFVAKLPKGEKVSGELIVKENKIVKIKEFTV